MKPTRLSALFALLLAFNTHCALDPTEQTTLGGHFESVGYGYYFSLTGSQLEAFETTAISCLPSFKAVQENGAEEAATFRMLEAPVLFELRPGQRPDQKWLHFNGTASDIELRRVDSAPDSCAESPPDTPQMNFEVFAQSWAELYGFFDLKSTDWATVVSSNRSRVASDTSQEDLFQVLRDMIEPLEDGHTYIQAEKLKKSWGGQRLGANRLERPARERAMEIVEENYLEGALRSWCNGRVQFGRLEGSVGYLRLRSFSGFGEAPGFQSGMVALEQALDEIFSEAGDWNGLVIDVRINGGGYDPYGLEIASRLATGEYLAYAKQARSDPEDPSQWTDLQPSRIRPSSRPGFDGPVVELQGIHSVSAAETFTQALFGREPRITRIGEHTQGVFSDVQTRTLPNGWKFGLPNERFITDGKSYDGPGIPPDVEVPVFPPGDLEAGRDGALDKALEFLRR